MMLNGLLLAFSLVCAPTLSAQATITIEFNGVSGELATNARLLLSLEQQKGHTLLSDARIRRLHKKAPQEISNALQPFGYYRPQIKSELVSPSANNWKAIYTIDPGPPLPVGQFNFDISGEIQADPAFKHLIESPPLRKGSVFNHLVYEDFKSSLAKLAAERGYFSARFSEHRVEIDLETYEARIYLKYDGGPRYHFGDVSMQQEVLSPDLLQRYIHFDKGSPYTLNDLIELQQALNDTDYFRTIEVSPGQAQADSAEIPISVILTPRKRHHYTIGLGYGTNTGLRSKFGWDITPLNRKGHRLNSEVKVSEIGYSIGTQYRVPVLNPRTDQIIYSAGVINEKTDTSDSTTLTVGASLSRNRGAWRESLSLNYQQEKFIVANDRGVSNLLIPGVNWQRIWGRGFIYTVDGLRFDIGLRAATRDLLSDTDFFQVQGGIKAINPLGRHNRIITSANVGGTWTSEFNKLPSSVRFFTGGAQGVRGYAYQSLGPADSSGKVVGGQYLIVGSIELEHNLNNKWGVALFYDTGNALDNLDDALEKGVGFGIRWKSPIGPVRIDFANAISTDDQPWRVHFNIGPDL